MTERLEDKVQPKEKEAKGQNECQQESSFKEACKLKKVQKNLLHYNETPKKKTMNLVTGLNL